MKLKAITTQYVEGRLVPPGTQLETTDAFNEAGDGEKRRITCFYLNGGMPLNQVAEFGVIRVSIRLLADPNISDAGEAATWEMEVQNTDEAA